MRTYVLLEIQNVKKCFVFGLAAFADDLHKYCFSMGLAYPALVCNAISLFLYVQKNCPPRVSFSVLWQSLYISIYFNSDIFCPPFVLIIQWNPLLRPYKSEKIKAGSVKMGVHLHRLRTESLSKQGLIRKGV